MRLKNLITVNARPLEILPRDVTAMAGAEVGEAGQPTGVFVTPQSLVTFPVASGAVTVIWKVLAEVEPDLETSKVAALIISFIIGLFLYFVGLTGTKTSTREKLIQFGIAIINTFWLAATALGVDATL